jgi:hypothetical protein
MTEYQLPEPKMVKQYPTGLIKSFYNADQMQQAYQAGREATMLPLIDRLVVLHIYRKEHETDTALALKDLIDYEVQIALDPQVSSDAQALIDRGREAMRQECVKHFDSKGFVEDHGSNFADEIRSLK